MMSTAMPDWIRQAMIAALVDRRRALSRSPSPMARDTSAVAAIIKPIPAETEKYWIAKANPMAATRRGSPSCDIQKRLAASTRKTNVMPIAPAIVMRTT